MSEKKKEIVNIPYYMPVAWDYMFENTETHGYRIKDKKDSLIDCVQEYSCANYTGTLFKENPQHPDLRVIVLDDEFVEWMEKHHYEKTEENIKKYLNIKRSDKEAFRLIKKNGLHKDYFYFAVPVMVINNQENCEDTKYILSAETIDVLHEHIQSIYEDCDVCVGRQLLKMKDFKKNKQVFEEVVGKYFDENAIWLKSELFAQKWSESEKRLHAMYIPIAIEYIHIYPKFTFEDIYKKNPFHPEYVELTKPLTETEEMDYTNITTINEEIDHLIQKDLQSKNAFVFVDYDFKEMDEILRYYRNMKSVWEVANA